MILDTSNKFVPPFD